MKFLSRFTAVLALTLLAGASLRAADSIDIKQRWVAGKKYFQTMQTNQQSTLTFGEKKMEQSSSMTVELTMAVSAAKDNEPKRMTIRYERTAMQISTNGQKMGFDSADPNPGNDPLGLAKTAGATVGKELKILLNDQDEVTAIENYDEFIKALAPSAVPGFDPAKMFGKDSLTQMLKQGGLHAVPGKPVTVGDTWPFKTEINLPQLGKVAMTGSYTLKGTGDHNGTNCAEITTDGTLSMEIGAVSGDADTNSALAKLGMKVTDGKLTGSIWFDPQLGFSRDAQLVEEMTISMKNPADPSATMTIPMKQTISVVLTKIEDLK
jgi:hypothetical protein